VGKKAENHRTFTAERRELGLRSSPLCCFKLGYGNEGFADAL